MELPPSDRKSTSANAISRRLTACVALCGCVSLAIYILLPKFLLAITSSVPSYASDVFPWVKSISVEALSDLHSTCQFTAALPYFACYGALFALYMLTLWLVRGKQSTKLQLVVFSLGAGFLISLFFAPVMLSSDVYAYAFFGRLLTVYGPAYASDPSVAAADPFLFLYGHNSPSVYGPLATLISAGVTCIAGTKFGLTALLFRSVAATAVLGGAALLWSSLRRYSPEHTTQGLVLFLWNPLVVLESGLSGHNDATMVALVLLGIWLHLQNHRASAVVALTLSALVKFVTGPLVPLYFLMLLRESGTWGDRSRLFARSALGVSLACGLIIPLAHARSTAASAQYASAPDFYANNFHELLFKELRHLLGENAESVKSPIFFTPWWIKSTVNTKLHASPGDNNAMALANIQANQPLLVIAPQGDDWEYIYDPATRRKGYINAEDDDKIIPIDAPEATDADPEIARLESCVIDLPSVLKANVWIRAITGFLFVAFGLFAAWRTIDFGRFLAWAPAVIVAMYFTIMTQIWPWYLMWALGLSALTPKNLPAKLAIALSVGGLSLYATIGFAGSAPEWVYSCRSIPAIVLPTLGVGCFLALKKLLKRQPNEISTTEYLQELPQLPDLEA